jgi:hypothetical protein
MVAERLDHDLRRADVSPSCPRLRRLEADAMGFGFLKRFADEDRLAVEVYVSPQRMAKISPSRMPVTPAEMLAGANRAAVVRADGTAEIIHFQDVAATDAGTFVLSTLLRGRRGTEVYVALHEPGEMFVMLIGPTACTSTWFGWSNARSRSRLRSSGFGKACARVSARPRRSRAARVGP